MRKPITVCLKIEIEEAISTTQKEKLLFSARDRMRSLLQSQEISKYKILFVTNNQE